MRVRQDLVGPRQESTSVVTQRGIQPQEEAKGLLLLIGGGGGREGGRTPGRFGGSGSGSGSLLVPSVAGGRNLGFAVLRVAGFFFCCWWFFFFYFSLSGWWWGVVRGEEDGDRPFQPRRTSRGRKGDRVLHIRHTRNPGRRIRRRRRRRRRLRMGSESTGTSTGSTMGLGLGLGLGLGVETSTGTTMG